MRKDSKLIKYPTFSALPQSEAANVPENITNWINRGKWNMISKFCRPSGMDDGYRFVTTDELCEIKIEHQTLLGKECTLIFSRFVERRDISFYPLWFSEWYVRVDVIYDNQKHTFKNDNQLKKFLRSVTLK